MPRAFAYLGGIAAILIVVVVGWRMTAPSVGAAPSPSPALTTATPTSGTPVTVDTLPCTPEDVHAFELSAVGDTPFRTQIALQLVGPATCTIDLPGLIIRGSDAPTTANANPPVTGVMKLQAGVVYTSELTITSWCAATPAIPASLELSLDMTVAFVEGWSIADQAGAPACNTQTGTAFSMTAWTSAPAST